MKRKINWDEFQDKCSELLILVKDEKFDFIVGIGRGGLIPAVILSHSLKIPLAIISASAYKGKEFKQVVLGKLSHYFYIKGGNKALLVDEIVDQNKTMPAIKEVLETRFGVEVKTAVLVNKGHKEKVVDYEVENCSKEEWIDFPYEVEIE